MLKLYTLFINGRNETALYRQVQVNGHLKLYPKSEKDIESVK
jgi:hypothetical protein